MKPVSDVVAAIGLTALIKLRAASEATGWNHSRQGGVHESGRVGQGPRGDGDHQ